jgi:hypothetical protein
MPDLPCDNCNGEDEKVSAEEAERRRRQGGLIA